MLAWPVRVTVPDMVAADVAPWQDTEVVVITHDTLVPGIVSLTVEVALLATAGTAVATSSAVMRASLCFIAWVRPAARC
jgi:hypothetical protein